MKKFKLMDLFSIVDGRLSKSGIDSVYDILNYLTQHSLFTHQLPVIYDFLKKDNEQHPHKYPWFNKAENDLLIISKRCPIRERNQEQFNWMMDYIEKECNQEYELVPFDDETNGKCIQYLMENSLLP